ncbi:unnamed protein product [Ceratitis capitata]|uniref:(Mediterranean fruit fly) hypothetical protein n=1 Tax=Ceratitis capitata TaxID=7213 RepID=A0A811UYK0_CERCA|nr:unnamed protein product [Ceratitis capitata]
MERQKRQKGGQKVVQTDDDADGADGNDDKDVTQAADEATTQHFAPYLCSLQPTAGSPSEQAVHGCLSRKQPAYCKEGRWTSLYILKLQGSMKLSSDDCKVVAYAAARVLSTSILPLILLTRVPAVIPALIRFGAFNSAKVKKRQKQHNDHFCNRNDGHSSKDDSSGNKIQQQSSNLAN